MHPNHHNQGQYSHPSQHQDRSYSYAQSPQYPQQYQHPVPLSPHHAVQIPPAVNSHAGAPQTYHQPYGYPSNYPTGASNNDYQASKPLQQNQYPSYPGHNQYVTPAYPRPPPSPSQSEAPQEEEEAKRAIPGPLPEMREYDGKKYGLVVVQQPIRARMCGFGDKDRRPISAPPIVKAIIHDVRTGKEIDYKNADLELSHFVCQVHIYDMEGLTEKSIVKTTQGQQIISASSASGFPATIMQNPARMSSRVSLDDPTYTSIHGNQHALNYSANPFNFSATNNQSMFPAVTGPPPLEKIVTDSFTPQPTPYNFTQTRGQPGNQVTTGPNQPPTPPMNKDDHGPGFSRNLIGSNTISGQLLEDTDKNMGIFFAFTDLSVRSEDWFRLKFSLFNVGEITTDLSSEEIYRKAVQNNIAPNAGSLQDASRNGGKRLEGLKAGLIAQTAPCLATVFSQVFKVYSAKKFPGVAEGTDLSKTFADQGVKISVRKDSNVQSSDKKRKHSDIDDFESQADDLD